MLTEISPRDASRPPVGLLSTASNVADQAVRYIAVALMTLLVAVVALQVICRYLLQLSFVGSEEIATYTFVWLIFLGASVSFKERAHPVLTIFTDHLPSGLARPVEIFGLTCTVLFIGYLFVRGTSLVLLVSTQRSQILEIPTSWIYAALPLSAAVTLLHLVEFAWVEKQLRIGDLPAIAVTIVVLGTVTHVDLKTHVYLVMVLAMIVFMLARVPIAVSMGLTTIVGMSVSSFPDIAFINRMIDGLSNFTLLAVPFFLLTGAIMAAGSLAQRLVDFANSLVGWIRGGLALSNILVSALFADISGSALADTAAIGSVMMPNMIRRGYDVNFTTALQASAGSLGMQFPPSISMLLYAWVAGVSTAALFSASFIPACLIALSFAAVAYVTAWRRKYPKEDRFQIALVVHSLRRCAFALVTPVIIVGGILAGAFTPTEAGVVAVLYSTIVSTILYRDMSFRRMVLTLSETASAVGRMMLIIGTAIGMSWIIIVNQGPQELGAALQALSDNSIIILLLINAFIIALGMFLETTAILLVVVPVVLPVLVDAGIDPVVFGVIFVTSCALGAIHPPVGLTLFIACNISGAKIEQASVAVIPFMLVKIIDILVLSIFPGLALFLPHWLGIY
jgi:tripartite ATP-independent transporter DctM subunit